MPLHLNSSNSGSPSTASNTPVIIGVVCGVAGFAGIVFVAYTMRRRSRNTSSANIDGNPGNQKQEFSPVEYRNHTPVALSPLKPIPEGVLDVADA